MLHFSLCSARLHVVSFLVLICRVHAVLLFADGHDPIRGRFCTRTRTPQGQTRETARGLPLSLLLSLSPSLVSRCIHACCCVFLQVHTEGERTMARLKKGAVIFVPKNVPFDRDVAGMRLFVARLSIIALPVAVLLQTVTLSLFLSRSKHVFVFCVAGQLPTGWNPLKYGITPDIKVCRSVSPLNPSCLCCCCRSIP